ncbi:MAG: hypothetical protein Q8T11_14310 [Elusimicrobiota bacterium]|nr:hypothetical protein [Elusimicrobiota bacterium]
MRSVLPVVSVIGLLGAGGAVTWSVFARPSDTFMTTDAASAFDLQTGPAPARPPARLAAGETLRDAVASAPPPASSLMRPIADPGMVLGGAPKAVVDKPFTVITPKAEAWAKRHRFLGALLAKPAKFLVSRSALGSGRELRAFLADPRKVDAYMNSTLVRVTLNSPAVAKALLGNPAVIRAFLASPAMRDPRAARALLGSPMVRKMLDCPAIQEALGDPVVIKKMLADPQTIAWIAAHPDALLAITHAVPALGGAFSAKTR